jgi:multicomponent K+:H+ antiporter subunit A
VILTALATLALLLAFMGAMLGIVLADNLILLVVFWELTSVTSLLLIGFWMHRADARAGVRMAIAVTGMGGPCLLGAFTKSGQFPFHFWLRHAMAAPIPVSA